VDVIKVRANQEQSKMNQVNRPDYDKDVKKYRQQHLTHLDQIKYEQLTVLIPGPGACLQDEDRLTVVAEQAGVGRGCYGAVLKCIRESMAVIGCDSNYAARLYFGQFAKDIHQSMSVNKSVTLFIVRFSGHNRVLGVGGAERPA